MDGIAIVVESKLHNHNRNQNLKIWEESKIGLLGPLGSGGPGSRDRRADVPDVGPGGALTPNIL